MRIEGMLPQQLISLSNLPDMLQRLEPGDIIRAQVLNFVMNELLLRLPDGTAFTATPQVPLDVSPGDTLNLLVKQKADQQLVLETVKGNTPAASGTRDDITRRLMTAGIPVDENSVLVAREMLNQGMSISREGYDAVRTLLEQNSSLTPGKAAFLAAAGMQENSGMFQTLEQLLKPGSEVGAGIQKLLASLNELAGNITKTEMTASVAMGAVEPGPEEGHIQTLAAGSSENTGTASSTKQQGVQTQQQANTGSRMPDFMEQQLKQLGQELQQIRENASIQKAPATPGNVPVGAHLETEKTGQLEKQGSPVLGSSVSLEDSRETTLSSALKKVEQQLSSLFVGKDLEELKQEGGTRKYYEKLLNTLDSVKMTLSVLDFQGRDTFVQRLEQVQNTARFLEQASNLNSYLQIPLNLDGKQTSAELYILRGKSRKKVMDPENITLYISLQTGSLGRVDSLLTVTGKNISMNIRTGNQTVLDFLRRNSTGLYQRIQDTGYKLANISYRVRQEETNPLNVQEYALRCLEESRYTFDFRV